MAVVMGQFTVPASSTVPVFTIPPGPLSITWYSTGAVTVFLGTSPNVSSANGLNCHSVPTSLQGFMTAKGAQIYATTGNASPSNVHYAIVTGQ